MDSVVYACGYAGQRTIREIHLDEESGCVASFTLIKELKGWVSDEGLSKDDYVVCSRVEVDPLNYVLHSAKIFVEQMLEDVNAEEYVFYLSGKNNFRYDIATILPYKGNRPPDKPVYYRELREYLVDRWGAIIIDGYEADDACIIEANELRKIGKDYVVITRDKDLFQFPGKFYRY